MKKTKGKYLILVGALLLLSAAALIIFNSVQDKKSGEQASKILTALEPQINEQLSSSASLSELTEPQTATENLFEKYEEPSKAPEKTIEIDGNSYIGMVVIPSLDIKLPVMSEWSYDKLKISPCRYFGRADDNNLIIAAHNYNSHFGGISKLSGGDEIRFISADGVEYIYEVTQTESLNGADVETMKSDDADSWSITLFTCTLSGRNRVCVRAALVQ